VSQKPRQIFLELSYDMWRQSLVVRYKLLNWQI